MKYIYLDQSGEQIGPVDESAVVQEILAGRLKADSAIRNALLREFCTVADFDCFADALAKAAATLPAEKKDRRDGFAAYLRKIADDQVEEEKNVSIAGTLHPGDASATRRTLAMLMDAIVLLAVLLLFFGPALGRLKDLGTSDDAELARLEAARTVRKAALKKAAKEQQKKAANAPAAAKTETAAAHAEAAPDRPHDTRRALVNMVAPNALKKLDRSYAQHNAAVEKAASGDRKKTPPAGRKRPAPRPAPQPESTEPKADVPPPTPPAPPETAIESKPVRPPKKLRPEDMPQVVFRNLPGAEWILRAFPSLADEVENRVLDEAGAGCLVTGCAADDADIRLRIGTDVRKISRAEFRANFAAPIKWAVLVILLYYTLAFSIFAQTLGMWFWGIFLTRSKVAEVLPFRAALYTACMLLFGILMIPMVLISKRSLADWLCGVRQIGVGSVSKS